MLRVPERSLPEPAAERLREYQRDVDAVEVYADRVAAGKGSFRSRNRKTNRTLRTIREILKAMCGGTGRCMYCEDSMADEIEHFKPKDLYPEAVFLWPNLLYACGPCNGTKRNRFYVFATTDDEIVDVTRAVGSEILPPVSGEPVLIDPRHEDPLALLALDLRGTFRFIPRARRGTRDYERAAHTIKILDLNGRDFLLEARRQAFESLIALLKRYVDEKREGGSSEALGRIRNTITTYHHPTVWVEVKRQRQHIDGLVRLFEQSPEALKW